MFSLTKRNLTLYFKNHGRLLFSILGALIAFLLYVIFIKNTMQNSWKMVPHSTKLLDLWLMAGTLAITSITTTNIALTQMAYDRESLTIEDLELTDLSYLGIQGSYLLNSVSIGTIMQLIMFTLMDGYFAIVDHLSLNLNLLPKLLLMMIFSSIVWTTCNLLILSLVKKVESLGLINTIVGTAAGFFAGVYVPMGEMPSGAQTFIKFIPASYTAAIYRKLLMLKQIASSFHKLPFSIKRHFENYMAFNLRWHSDLNIPKMSLILIGFSILFIIIFIPISRLMRYSKSE
ncbi:multidrug ABC transporter permease [Philodulcilactobacillus myokoensis]|uniref:Multidrug ABC transporter permease n=1 Tax=Philodulcilactobacillus myokoensis TaxID=2929573 RepID=A0A9W6EU46_9LACO|nr:ABC transporter permease [Philodulcilactobacillus myokoensis]GLB47603.1 multidrug ABC transporter permease [Philodulcilactobacillus myokoensis]